MVLTYLPMAKRNKPDPKTEALRQRGCLNPYPEKVADPLFAGSDFFDARELDQVKYEMVRRSRINSFFMSAMAVGIRMSHLPVPIRFIPRGTGIRYAM